MLLDANRTLIRSVRLFALAGMAVCFSAVSCAQSGAQADDLRAEIEQLKQQQADTQAELDELKEILGPILDRLPKPFRPQEVSLANSPVLGSASAKITMVEFSDLQCPYCVKYYNETYPEILKDYVDTGKVRYVIREFPLTSIHKEAQRAAQAALCAARQNKYWELRKVILQNRHKLGDEDLTKYAATLGVNMALWRDCMASDIYSKKVKRDMRDGSQLGVRGTPAFAIGLTDPNNPNGFMATKLIEGAYPYDAFVTEFEKLLKSAD